MNQIRLTARAREQLQEVARSSTDARPVRRAQALLWLEQGTSIETVAERLHVSRQTIYSWIGTYQKRQAQPVIDRVCDQPHSGRPPTKLQCVKQRLRSWLKRKPQRWGYASPIWTAPMLRCQVQRDLKETVSLRTVRRALRALRYRYKRPRLVLARRSPTWRQAKGA
jgi:transposase